MTEHPTVPCRTKTITYRPFRPLLWGLISLEQIQEIFRREYSRYVGVMDNTNRHTRRS